MLIDAVTHPVVTIIVPMRNEEAFIAQCLASLQAQEYPAAALEFLVVDGESTDRSREIVEAIRRVDPRVRLLENPRRHQGAGLNIGLNEARGDIIVRADAHAVYGPAYVPIIVAHLVAGRAENVGGAQRAEGTTLFGKAVAAALGTRLGAGNAPYRLASETRYVDTVWLGAWHARTLRGIGGFDERMINNQDYECNCRLRKAGGRILFDPSLPSTYYTRSSPQRLWKQFFRYGLYKVLTLKLHPDSLVLRQLAPPVAIGVLLASIALLPFFPWPFIVVWGSYLAVVILVSVGVAARKGFALLLPLLLVFPSMHFAWALGFYWGVARFRGFHFDLPGLLRSERLVRRGAQKPGEEVQ